jgi:predicted nucleotidyltransferase
MPVRPSSSHVLAWPPRDVAEEAARPWGAALKASRSDVVRVGYFGSYARGDWVAGNDPDLVVVLTECDEPPLRCGLTFDTISGFPVPVDLLVNTLDESRRLSEEGAPSRRRLSAEVSWVVQRGRSPRPRRRATPYPAGPLGAGRSPGTPSA